MVTFSPGCCLSVSFDLSELPLPPIRRLRYRCWAVSECETSGGSELLGAVVDAVGWQAEVIAHITSRYS